MMRRTFIAGLAVVLAGAAVSAQEVTLRAVSSFAEGTEFSKNFERFVEKVNNDGKGVIKINYIGGPRAVPPFEVGNAVRTRVVDIANVTGAFYTNLMPEADGFKLNGKPMSEQRKNGTWEYINQLHNQKLNSQYLARQFHNVPFHIYLNKKIDKVDFSGLKIRVTPVYKDVVEALGGTPITTPPGGGLHRARARRGRRLRLAGHRHLRSRLGQGDEVPPGAGVLRRRGQRAGQSRRLEGPQRCAAQGAQRRGAVARRPRRREGRGNQGAARAAGGGRHPGARLRPGGIEGVPRQGLRGGVAIRHQARAGERPKLRQLAGN